MYNYFCLIRVDSKFLSTIRIILVNKPWCIR